VGLGLLWLVDACLQAQPEQFSPRFALSLEENAMAQPGRLGQVIVSTGRLLGSEVRFWNLTFVAAQVALASLILVRRTRGLGLAASIPWALLIWMFGEGLGGLLTGFAMLPTGAPGAALLYAVLAGVCIAERRRRLLPGQDPRDPGVATRRLEHVWSAVWLGGAVLQALPVNSFGFKLSAGFGEAADGQPRWLAVLDHRVSGVTGGHGAIVTAALIGLEVLVGFAPWLGRLRSPLFALGLGLAVVFWLVGENLGGLLTGSANDVGTMPLVALLAGGIRRRGAWHRPQLRYGAVAPLGWLSMRSRSAMRLASPASNGSD